MAVSAVMAAASTAVGVVAGTIAISSAFTYFMVSTAMGAALNALSPKPVAASATRGYSISGESGAALDHQIIYGKTKVGGVRIYDSTTGGEKNKYLHRILVFAGHEIDSYVKIYVNDDEVIVGTAYEYTVQYPWLSGETRTAKAVISSGDYTVGQTLSSSDNVLLPELVKNDSLLVAVLLNFSNTITITGKKQLLSRVISPSRYVNNLRIKAYYGTNSQTADADLISDTTSLTPETGQWTSNHKLSGLAYLYVRFEYDADIFPNGIPSVSAVIKGKKVYDPRTTTTAWSENPALCLRDYLTQDYGLAVPASRVSDDHVITAANICDQSVTTNLGTTTRFTCNGAFLTAFSPNQVISDLITSMGGLFWYSQGKWRIKASAYTTPTVTLNEDDLRSSVSVSTRHSRRDTFNTVKGKFKGAESDWQEADYPQVVSQASIDADNGLVNTADYSLPFTTSSITSQRIAKIFLYRNREQLTVSASFGLKAFQVEVGDIVNLSLSRFGWLPKAFEVTNWSFGLTDGLDLQVNLTLREISSNVFEDVDGSSFETNNSELPSAFAVPSVGLTVTSETEVSFESLINTIYVEVTASDETAVERVEVQYKLSSKTVWNAMGIGDLGTYQVAGVVDGLYDVRVRSYSYLGVKSAWSIRSGYQVSTDAPPPEVVAGFSYNLSGGVINFNWFPVSNLDLSYYRIRHSQLENGATWSDATTAVNKVSRPATTVSIPLKPGTYMIRAYNKSGKTSTTYSSIVIPVINLESYINNLSLSNDTTFLGNKINTSVVSSSLRLTTYNTTTSTGSYEFTTYIDTTTARRVRARIDVGVTRYSSTTGLFDDLVGLFDDQPGMFDDLTGFSGYDDIDVVTYISTTTDNPAGTPTWSAYQPFVSGDFYGRAFRFKIELNSSSPNITPSVGSLTARIQYN